MKFDICRLCKKKKDLRKSHVIQRAIFKKVLRNVNYARTLNRKINKVVNTQDQWATYLLCAECEHHLNSNYEKYALNVLRNKYHGVKHQEKDNYLQIVNVNQKLIIIYLISIFWRAVESNHEVFNNLKGLKIDSIIRELLRNCILKGETPSNSILGVRVSKLSTLIEGFKNIELNFISNFTCNLDDKKRIKFSIIFEGYYFEIFFYTTPSERVTGLGVLSKNKRILQIPRIETFSIPELRQSISEMIEAYRNN